MGLCILFCVFTVICGMAHASNKGDVSTSCQATIDPHQCVYTKIRQKCYRQGTTTKCRVTGWGCQAGCCNGWKTDMKGKCSIQTNRMVCNSPVDSTKGDSRFCQDDSNCKSGETCCSNACSSGFQLNQCLYDNELHTTGETMTGTNNMCYTCTCNGNGGRNTVMTCTTSKCSWAQNETDIPSDYKPPEIKNAPQKGQKMSVYVLPTINMAQLNYESWSGVDFEGTHLNIKLSNTTFEHCLCNNSREIIVYLKTDPDRYGNYYQNIFPVNVIDKYKPVFTKCPHDQTVNHNETIVWEAPTASDNVGVRSLIDPNIKNNTTLPPGKYSLFYEATDWSNNVAYCTFTITVKRIPDAARESNVALIIGALSTIIATLAVQRGDVSRATIGGVFILIIALVTVFAVCRVTDKNIVYTKNRKVYEGFANEESYGSTIPQKA